MMRGKLITVEGIEGAGKSTVLPFIQTYLTHQHIHTLLTREPGGTIVAEDIRKILLHAVASETIQANTELLLMFASRAQHIAQVIRPALAAGTWVISDRYVDASYAYQGGGRGIAMKDIAMLDTCIVGNIYPDLTLLLDIPADLGSLRANKRTAVKDRIEQEQVEFFERVRSAYLDRAQEAPQRIKIIHAHLSLTQVQEQIRLALDEFMVNVS